VRLLLFFSGTTRTPKSSASYPIVQDEHPKCSFPEFLLDTWLGSINLLAVCTNVLSFAETNTDEEPRNWMEGGTA
jgi:hypothetical protein